MDRILLLSLLVSPSVLLHPSPKSCLLSQVHDAFKIHHP